MLDNPVYNNLIELIKTDYSLNEICSTLNLNREQIYKMLRDLSLLGIDFDRKYFADGEIFYVPKKEVEASSKNNTVDIITSTNSKNFRALLISDLHIGSTLERRDTWDIMMNYCIKEGIHVIIIAGDFLDGINIGKADCKIHTNAFEQMVYATQNYPRDDSITNFVVFGNHDVDSLVSDGINFSNYLRNFRHDIVPVGYGVGRINIKNDKIFVTHPLCIGVNKEMELTSNYFLIKGHHHNMRSIIGNNGNCSLTLPSLSDMFLSTNEFLPGAIDLNIKFKHGYFDTIYYEYLLVNNNKVCTISTTQFSILHSKDRHFDGPIKHEKDRVKKRVLNNN